MGTSPVSLNSIAKSLAEFYSLNYQMGYSIAEFYLLLHRTFGVGQDPNERDRIGCTRMNWRPGLCSVESRGGGYCLPFGSIYWDDFVEFLRNRYPRTLPPIEHTVLPVLFSYQVGAREPYAQLYSPVHHITVDRHLLSGIRIGDFNLVSHNYRECKMLLVNPKTREVCIYVLAPNFSEDQLVRIANLPVVEQNPYIQLGCFARYVADEGLDDAKYEILIFDFVHEGVLNYSFIRTFRKSPLRLDNTFMWVNQWDGAIFIMENWNDPMKPLKGIFRFRVKPLQDCRFVFGLVHDDRPVFVAVRRRTVAVYEFSLRDRDGRKVSLCTPGTNANLMHLEDLCGYTFFCSRLHQGFSGLVDDASYYTEKNSIFMGGFRGDCCRTLYDGSLKGVVGHSGFTFPEDKANLLRSDILRVETALQLKILRRCHAARGDSHPFDSSCECAFFEVPLNA